MQSFGVAPHGRRGAWATPRVLALLVVVLCFGPQRGCRHPAFLRAAEWAEKTRLEKDDALPLVADITLDVGIQNSLSTGCNFTGVAGRGSYIADFGILDVPVFREVRARAGLRYSRLYPRGALELGFRKELRADEKKGYELFLGLQTAGDDERLDVLGDIGALKYFRGAKAFYRFLWGLGWPYGKSSGSGSGPQWNEMGSSLGVTQTEMPPSRRGELTVGWRNGLFDNGMEGVVRPRAESHESVAGRKRKDGSLWDSSPYAEYGIGIPLVGNSTARVSCTVLPVHDVVEHGLHVTLCNTEDPRLAGVAADGSLENLKRGHQDERGGAATFSAIVDQSISDPSRLRLRLGSSFVRG